ncbi:MAG: helix-turn-helix domain-containing protein [Rhodopseudomonas palustris]|nr:helix-turn-helix domain-containing protein [Rhodopseudomonas palustris]
MRDNSFDRTIERNYIQKWRFLIAEYEAVKEGRSPQFRRVGDFYRHHGTCSQTFRKYYNRYLQSGDEAGLLPRRRGRSGGGVVSRRALRRRSSPPDSVA